MKKKNIPQLTGLRFLAAFAIIMNHLVPFSLGFGPDTKIGAFSTNDGFLGMTLFFVLSGFIIHYNYYEKIMGGIKQKYKFFVARFSRLYPLFILFVFWDVSNLMFHALKNNDPETVNRIFSTIPIFILGIQSWFYALIGNRSIVYSYDFSTVTWSISTEFFFYLFYPIIAKIIGKLLHWKRIIFISILLIIVNSIAFYYIYNGYLDNFAVSIFGSMAGKMNNNAFRFSNWLGFLSPYIRIFEFLVGCLIAQLWSILHDRPASVIELIIGPALLAISLIYIIISWLPFSMQPDIYKLVFNFLQYRLAVPIIIFGLVRYKTFFSNILSGKIIVAFGDASYSIYILQLVIIRQLAYGGSRDNILAIFNHGIGQIVLIIFLAILSFRYIETPARRWLKKILLF